MPEGTSVKFKGKTIVVTGSGKEKGLGQGILQRFADDGANCVVSDLSIGDEEEGVAEELRGRGAKVATIACDVSDAQQCQALVDQSVDAFGSVDIFVNNAGIGFMMKPLLDVDPADWAAVIGVNLSRSEEHTSELQSRENLVCRLLLEKKKT